MASLFMGYGIRGTKSLTSRGDARDDLVLLGHLVNVTWRTSVNRSPMARTT